MDYMTKGDLKNRPIRFFTINAKDTVQNMQTIHKTTPNATACAGRSLMATALIGYDMKNEEDVVTTTLSCDGEIGKVTCTSNTKGEVKCDIINPKTGLYLNDAGKLDVKKIVGNGTLRVIKDIGLKMPYVGETDIISGEIAEDYTYYFAKSEQVPSVVSLGVFVEKEDVTCAGGLIIQLLPGATEEDICYLEEKVEHLKYMTTLLKEGKTIEEIVIDLFNDEDLEFTDKRNVSYKCNCSREKIEKVVLALGKDELTEILKKEEGITLKCHFCNTEYHLNKEELTTLMAEA